MWSHNLKSRRNTDNCAHEKLEVSTAAGLQRKVCLSCGHVSISFVSDTVEVSGLDHHPAEV